MAAGREADGSILLAAVPSSLGIRRHAEQLSTALTAIGVPVRVAAGPNGAGPVHFHFGNSSRSLLPALARRRGDLVTVHDVLPRARWLQRVLTPAQTRLLARHRVVVHSHHAADILRSRPPGVEALVIPLSFQVPPRCGERPNAPPSQRPDQKVAVVAGVLKQAKGIGELVGAAGRHPGVRLVLVGRVADRATERQLSSLPDNVVHIPAADDEAFLAELASADIVISMKRDSVGEASGPVVQAHLLGTPVAGLRVGSLPEYCGVGDLLLDPSATADDLLTAVLEAPRSRIPPHDLRCLSIEDAAERYAQLYRQLGWW